MDKSPEEQAVEKKISQYQNCQKILLNRKRTEEHRARTHRLIERGAILEAVFPAVVEMEGEEVIAICSTSVSFSATHRGSVSLSLQGNLCGRWPVKAQEVRFCPHALLVFLIVYIL